MVFACCRPLADLSASVLFVNLQMLPNREAVMRFVRSACHKPTTACPLVSCSICVACSEMCVSVSACK